METKEKKVQWKAIVSGIFILIILATMIYGTIKLWPLAKQLENTQKQAEFREWIKSFRWWGLLIMIGIQILQVVVAFLPGEVVEVVMGMMYGVIGGIIVCWIGLAIATIIIFYLVRLLGKPIVKLFVSEKNAEKLKFIKNADQAEAVFLFAFLLPGTPKDVLIYLAPATSVKLHRFLIISLVGRIPSLLLSTLIGHHLISGEYAHSLTYTIITIVLAIIGILFYRPIINFLERKVLHRKKAVANDASKHN